MIREFPRVGGLLCDVVLISFSLYSIWFLYVLQNIQPLLLKDWQTKVDCIASKAEAATYPVFLIKP